MYQIRKSFSHNFKAMIALADEYLQVRDIGTFLWALSFSYTIIAVILLSFYGRLIVVLMEYDLYCN